MSENFKDFEDALISSRDDFIVRQNKAVEHAREQFGKKNVKEKKLERPKPSRSQSVSSSDSFKTGHIVRLAVRRKQIALDEMFEYKSDKLSKLEARLDAEKAAKKAGYPIIGYVYSIDKL
jgi:hypothetical protein